MNRWCHLLIVGPFLVPAVPEAKAQSRAALARETAESVLAKFGKEAAQEGGDALTRRIEALVVRHGEDAAIATRKVGPKTFRYIEEAGEQGPHSIRLMARYGDEAVWVVAHRNRLAIFVKFGDDAAVAMMKHREIAEPILRSEGSLAGRALRNLSSQNGRRLVMMHETGEWAKVGAKSEFFDLIGRYGDRAMNFVWDNRTILLGERVRRAFLSNPEPFLEGSDDLRKHTDNPIANGSDSRGPFLGRSLILVSGMIGCIALSCRFLWHRLRRYSNR